jgi:Flp pilus assembly protein TadG
MAIIFPLLLLMVGAIIDLGRFMFTKEMLTNAAREGARMVAVGYTTAQADTRITQALAGGVQIAANSYVFSSGTSCPTTPGPTDTVTVTVSTPSSGTGQFKYLILGPASRLVGGTTALTAPVLSGTASMRCGG